MTPNGHIEHLQHPLLQFAQRHKVHIVQARQQIQQKADPAPRVYNGKPTKGFRKYFLQWFGEILDHIRPSADAGEGGKLINCPGVQMVIVQKVCQRQLQTAVLRKAGRSGHQPGGIAVRGANVVQNVLGSLPLQLDIAALGGGDKSIFDFLGYAASGVGQQGGKLILEVIPLVGLADKVQHGQAFLVLLQPQATAQLLEEDGQGLGGAQEQHRIDLRDVHALVVNVHHENEANLAAHQPPLGGFSLIVRGFPGQENGADAVTVEIAAHELRMFDGHAEA